MVDADSISLWNCYCLRQDPREFSDDISEDSGFEESVGATDDRKREQRLENDKYDMALEVRLPIPDMYSSPGAGVNTLPATCRIMMALGVHSFPRPFRR